ncbi:MAG: metallophosphoesterase family protein [Bacteroidales bacterium]|nr:metallophosphoesterase family protein [Bacteroidales bacterium]
MKRLTLTFLSALVLAACAKDMKYEPAAELQFNERGCFKIIQLTDTHFISGDPRSERSLKCVEEVLDAEKPDFVIHTGDIIFGPPAQPGLQEIFAPLVRRGIPFAVALGNHDGQFDLDRAQVYEAIRQIPGCVNRPASEKGITGDSNDYLTLSSADSLAYVFYLLDSGDKTSFDVKEKAHNFYDYIRFDQVEWYRTLSARFRERNGGNPVPSLAFFHIPLPEMISLAGHKSAVVYGNKEEKPCPSEVNSGLYGQFLEMGDVFAVVNGHEHDCDFVLDYGPVRLMYGRYSGGETVYNHLGAEGRSEEKVSGVRIFEFRRGVPGFTTWVRLYGGEKQQLLHISPQGVTALVSPETPSE